MKTVDPTSIKRPVPVEKMPGHWLLSQLGKRVLRPGGLELTRRMLDELAIEPADDVIEFAPGLGVTARLALARRPRSYTAIERDAVASATVKKYLHGDQQRLVQGSAADVPLPNASATVVYGEAMLSMQTASAKQQIVAEAARLLRPGGRYAIHELCVTPDDVEHSVREAIAAELSSAIHVGVRPLTGAEWRALLEQGGLTVTAEQRAPMHLLEPLRVVRDEGWRGALRFAWNLARQPAARRRVLAMRRIFHKYRQHLGAIALIATKSEEQSL
jgi:SAM-dependent methyltransferase